MKILLTGGGTGGHFYPIIAVAYALKKSAEEQNIQGFKLFYLAPDPYDQELLTKNNIVFIHNGAGKLRRYFSLKNITDLFVTTWGIVTAIWKVYRIYPDVVFAKGGYVSFPVLVAARFLRIPVIIHESDSVPGRMNAWAGKFARRIAISYPTAASYFPADRVAFTGNPIRQELLKPVVGDPYNILKLERDIPVILILGGSQGSKIINEHVLDAMPQLVEKFQIIHQTGKKNYDAVEETVGVVMDGKPHAERYKPYDHLDIPTLHAAANVATLIISRAGSTIFEIALWGIPAILIPITDSNGDHQRKNAYSYARTGAAVVIEEGNLRSNIIVSEVDRLMSDPGLREKMKIAAKSFSRANAAELIAQEILAVSAAH